jgi:hypothetical protein
MSRLAAIDLARSIWLLEPCARPFELDLLLHLRHGYVYSTPRSFVMWRRVKSDALPEQIVDPSIEFGPEADAWFVFCAAGTEGVARLFEAEPYPLPFIGWERDNKIRFYKRERLIKCTRKFSE